MFAVPVQSACTGQHFDDDDDADADADEAVCSHVCLALSQSTFTCACPTFGALVLARDNLTCVRTSLSFFSRSILVACVSFMRGTLMSSITQIDCGRKL